MPPPHGHDTDECATCAFHLAQGDRVATVVQFGGEVVRHYVEVNED